MNIDTSKITRVEVISEGERAFVKWDCQADVSIQDGGRTIKIFIDDKTKLEQKQ